MQIEREKDLMERTEKMLKVDKIAPALHPRRKLASRQTGMLAINVESLIPYWVAANPLRTSHITPTNVPPASVTRPSLRKIQALEIRRSTMRGAKLNAPTPLF